MRSSFLTTLLTIAASALIASCGGGNNNAPVAPTTTISGSAVKGPVNGATVTVKNAATGAVLGTTTTGAGGTYKIDIAFTGDVIVEVGGGTYADEATGASTPLATTMKVVLAANGGAVTGIVTPLTTMAFNSAFGASGKPNAKDFNTVAAALAAQFNLTGINLATTLPTVSGSTDAYGKVLKGISQYLKDNTKPLASLMAASLSNADWTAFSGAFSTAYLAANGTAITFSFDGSKLVIAVGGGTPGASAAPGSMTVAYTVAGVPAVSINIPDVDKPGNATEFCEEANGASSPASLSEILPGATIIINSCTFSGTVGNINATVTIPPAPAVTYVMTFTFH